MTIEDFLSLGNLPGDLVGQPVTIYSKTYFGEEGVIVDVKGRKRPFRVLLGDGRVVSLGFRDFETSQIKLYGDDDDTSPFEELSPEEYKDLRSDSLTEKMLFKSLKRKVTRMPTEEVERFDLERGEPLLAYLPQSRSRADWIIKSGGRAL